MSNFKVGGKYKTRTGKAVIIVSAYKNRKYGATLIGIVDHGEYEACNTYTPAGHAINMMGNDSDLIQTRRVEFWVNVYEDNRYTHHHLSREGADSMGGVKDRLTCIHICEDIEVKP